jgi:glycosyltransferase involved in cell wall biosynthesis
VVATDVGGCPELVEDGRTGLVVPPAQPGALASAILRLLEDARLRDEMGMAGKARAADEFGYKRWLDATELAYLELLGERQASSERAAALSHTDPG